MKISVKYFITVVLIGIIVDLIIANKKNPQYLNVLYKIFDVSTFFSII